MTVVRDILAVIGALTVTGTAGILAIAWRFRRIEKHRYRTTRDFRALRPANQVAQDSRMWADYWTDHELPTTNPKEDR
ncbi:hypothetical protein GCM10023194_81210 [Planotetraspora phitsanulokensis]|uniref:Uncharacterized protein n=1 Tax=Planotetraspora phitsanulokensis TaxID=575192 RepID=A0A8J3UDH5_9ACTN|nr:hypothetical protein [Planotetraspora phitsanulokensis]GII42842.1 hypothetical protein Pph01_78450 [Planotetraspora phitsanulokensis]